MVLRSGIGKPSPALKSTFKTKNQAVGFTAEQVVIYLLKKKNWVLQFQRLKTKVAEVDLIFTKDNQVLLIEVKKLNDQWRAFERIQNNQVLKLQKNIIYFSHHLISYHVNGYVCWVDRNNKVSFVQV